MPQEHGQGHAAKEARERLTHTLKAFRDAGLLASGMIGNPDPYEATMNALHSFRVDDVVISTLPATKSGWLRGDLIERVRDESAQARRARRGRVRARPRPPSHGSRLRRPRTSTSTTARPQANRSSRVEPQLLGMLLFIISEVMIFGAFFTAYFFIRVVQGEEWPAPGTELPVAIAGVNTAILLSSSLTMHWAQTSIKNGNRFGLKAGILSTFLLGATFLFVQINEYVHIGFSPQDTAQGSIFYGLTGLHGAHVFVGLTLLAMVTDPRVPRVTSRRSSTAASRCRGSTGTSST